MKTPHLLVRTAMSALTATALVACQPQANGTAATDSGQPAEMADVAAVEGTSTQGRYKTLVVASGLEHPWAVAPLPDGSLLVTERPGRMRRVSADGAVSAPLTGVPAVYAQGQGGLLDVVLAPDFATSQRIYFSYAEPGDGDLAGTAVAHATLGDAGLSDVIRIYQQQPKVEGKNHFGSRLAFDHDGHIFISQGERQQRLMAQDLDKLQGKLVRLNLDGSVPADNPFVGQSGARPEIWSYGHRNMQGMAVDPRTGKLWQSEHGPRGGDEINLPQPGRNYGWPIITDGINYSGLPIPEAEGKDKPGMERPYHVWAKSPALSGMAFYTGHTGKPWNDSLFLGSLVEQNLIRLQLKGDRIVEEERLLADLKQRVRDVRVADSGAIYVLTDEKDGQLLRIMPPEAP